MTEETAKLLIEAMDRLTAVLGPLTGVNTLTGGIHVYHHGAPAYSPPQAPGPLTPHFGPNWSGPSSMGGG